MSADETKDMERIPLYQTEVAKKVVREKAEERRNIGEHLMRAIDYLARYINRDKNEPKIIETRYDLLVLEKSMVEVNKIPEEIVRGAFVNMANTAQKTWENEKRSVHEMPAVQEEDIEAKKMRAKITGVSKVRTTPISKAKEKRTSSS